MSNPDEFSDSFTNSLSAFLNKCAIRLKETVEALGCAGEKNKLLGTIAQNISGVTEKQLQVFNIM